MPVDPDGAINYRRALGERDALDEGVPGDRAADLGGGPEWAGLDDPDLRRLVRARMEAALLIEVPTQLVEAAVMGRIDELASAQRLCHQAPDRASLGGVELDPVAIALQDDGLLGGRGRDARLGGGRVLAQFDRRVTQGWHRGAHQQRALPRGWRRHDLGGMAPPISIERDRL